jgi:hypothetical protein
MDDLNTRMRLGRYDVQSGRAHLPKHRGGARTQDERGTEVDEAHASEAFSHRGFYGYLLLRIRETAGRSQWRILSKVLAAPVYRYAREVYDPSYPGLLRGPKHVECAPDVVRVHFLNRHSALGNGEREMDEYIGIAK